jgi:hypothetical protein
VMTTVLGDGVGAVGLPLASVPLVTDRYLGFKGHCVGTMNVDFRAPGALFYMALSERGTHCHKNDSHPRPSHVMEIFHNREITFLTFPPLISISQS